MLLSYADFAASDFGPELSANLEKAAKQAPQLFYMDPPVRSSSYRCAIGVGLKASVKGTKKHALTVWPFVCWTPPLATGAEASNELPLSVNGTKVIRCSRQLRTRPAVRKAAAAAAARCWVRLGSQCLYGVGKLRVPDVGRACRRAGQVLDSSESFQWKDRVEWAMNDRVYSLLRLSASSSAAQGGWRTSYSCWRPQ